MGIVKVLLSVLLSILGAAVGLLLLFVIVCSISVLFVDMKTEYKEEHPLFRFYANVIVGIVCFFCGIKLKVTGIEKIPTDRRFVFVSNHRSNFDPLVALWVMRKYHVSFISKPSNFKIPVIGRIAHRCCFMSIDRENPRNAIKAITRSVDLINRDEVSIGVYPEGTRSKDAKMLPFHDGVLMIAQKSKVPVVVSTIQGTEKIQKNFPFRRTEVKVDFLDCIETMEKIKTADLAMKVRHIMEENLPEERDCDQTATTEEESNT